MVRDAGGAVMAAPPIVASARWGSKVICQLKAEDGAMRAQPQARSTSAAAWSHLALKLAAAALIAAGGNAGHAEITQVYTFEGETDGFGPNGLDVDVTSDTIGATQGTGSLKLDIGKDATFVGALTTLLPPEIGDPPGLDFVVFDVTIPTAFPEAGFVNAGITVFGYTQPDYPTGQ
jgi:hypothetical protein